MSTTRFDPDEIAILEEERDFLLRSIDDLEAEWSAGEIDEARYEALRADYTARAAAVIRTIRDGLDRPLDAPVSLRRRLTVAGGVLLLALVAGAVLSRSLGERLPGGTLTGNGAVRPASAAPDDPSGGGQDAPGATDSESGVCPVGAAPLDELESAALRSTRDRLRYAGALLERGDAFEALRVYDEAAHLAPDDPEPLTCGAQIVFASGLHDTAIQRLDAALALDDRYVPAYYLRGLFRLRSGGDVDQAAADLRRALDLAPGGTFADDITGLLENLARP